MPRHISQDTVLKRALGLLEPPADLRVRNHLGECTKCLGQMEDVERTIRLMENISPDVTAQLPALPSRRQVRHGWLRVAAMLAVGFGLGFLTSESLHSPATTVVRQLIVPAPPAGAAGGFVACDAIDVSGGMQ